MKKELIVLGVLLMSLIFLISYDFGEKEKFDYVWTTAVCSGNECQDFKVECLNGEVIEMVPLTGVVIFDEDWEDIREDKGLC